MDVIKLTEDLIKIDSRNPFYAERDSKNPKNWIVDGNETEIAEVLEIRLEESGFNVEKQYVHTDKKGTKFYNLIAEKGDGNKSILFYGHMDTVTAKPWLSEKDALIPKIKMREILGEQRETIVGLGAADMKAGDAAIATAFSDINPEGYKIKVAFGVDEEFYSLGANILASSDFLDDVKAIMVPEVGDGPNTCYGASTITLGRLGRCEYVIKVPGTGGHGAQSKNPNFINAAVECAKIITDIEPWRKSYKDEYKFFECIVPDKNVVRNIDGSFFISRIESGKGSLSIPSEGEIIVDYTFTPNVTIEQGLEKLEAIIGNMYKTGKLKEFSISGKPQKVTAVSRERPTPSSDAYITSENSLFTQYVRNVVDEKVGFQNFNVGYSVADENVFARERKGIPILGIGPIGADYHKADEWVEIESVRDVQKVYSEIGKRFGDYLSR